MHLSSLAPLGAVLGLVATSSATITDGTWEELAEIPLYPRQEDTGVVLNDTTFAIMGGVIPYAPQNLTVGNTTSITQFYDVPSGTWTRGPDIPQPRNHVNAVGYEGKAVSDNFILYHALKFTNIGSYF